MELHVLSAGAAKGLVEALEPALHAATGATLRGEFGAVGAIREKWRGGAPCDVIILTAAMLDTMAQDGRVVPETIAPLGRVRTGIAVRVGEAPPAIADREELRRSLLAAKGLYLPDAVRSTAGVHFMNVLRELGIHDEVVSRLRAYESGAVAMRELGQSREENLIGLHPDHGDQLHARRGTGWPPATGVRAGHDVFGGCCNHCAAGWPGAAFCADAGGTGVARIAAQRGLRKLTPGRSLCRSRRVVRIHGSGVNGDVPGCCPTWAFPGPRDLNCGLEPGSNKHWLQRRNP
jgi:molybdate transport system substrate-binding protein